MEASPSSFERDMAEVRRLLHSLETSSRSLTPDEITGLEGGGNRCGDGGWQGVRVTVAEAVDPSRVSGTTFAGRVYLGSFGGTVEAEPGVHVPAGIYGSTVSDAVVGSGALVQGVALLARTVVGERAVVSACGTITCSGGTSSFGAGLELEVAVEVGGREVTSYAGLTLEEAARVAGDRSDKAALAAHTRRVAAHIAATKLDRSVIGAGAVAKGCLRLDAVCMAPGARAEGATIRNSTILSGAVVEASQVEDSIVQGDVRVVGGSLVTRSVLCESSYVERHGIVGESIVGPCSGVAEGECTAR